MKKSFILLFVMFVCVFALNACADNSNEFSSETENSTEIETFDTNYYTPKVGNSYEQLNVEEFDEKMTDKISKGLKYDYVGLEYQFKNPVTMHHSAELKKDYIVQKINNSYFIDNEKNTLWISSCESNYLTSNTNKPVEYIWVNTALKEIYSVRSDAKYYKNPYSYEYEYKAGSETILIKAVFGDDFLVESLNITSNSNHTTVNMKYFNMDDLPTGTGTIKKETFQDIAFVRCFKKINRLKQMKVEINAKRIILDMKTTYDEEYDVYLTEPIIGDAEAILFYDFKKMPYINGGLETSGIVSYIRVFNKMEIIKGSVGTSGEGFLQSAAEAYPFAYSSVFVNGMVTSNSNDIANISYTNNPLSVSLKSKEVTVNAEFNEFGAISMYTYKRKGSYSYQANFIYIK